MLEKIKSDKGKALIEAAKNVKWKNKRAEAYLNERFRGVYPPFYDKRNISNLASMLIDISGKAEGEREAYFDREIKKIADAFENPGAIKDFFSKMYGGITINEDIDWSNPRDVESVLNTIKTGQALATMVYDFKKDALGIFSTREQKEYIDAVIAKAHLLYLNVAGAIEDAGYGEEVEQYVQIGLKQRGQLASPALRTGSEVCSAVYDATMNGKNDIVLDPTKHENMKSFFFDKKILMYEYDDTPYTERNYAEDFMNSLASASMYTSFEQMMFKTIKDADPDLDFGYQSLLCINGKPVEQIVNEMCRKMNATSRASVEPIVGKLLRDALTDGKSVVTLSRIGYTLDGRVKFNHREIKADLNSLNEADRRESRYNFIRRFLDKHGIWKIQKYPTNESRDARQQKVKESESFKRSLQAIENRALNIYNNINAEKKSEGHLVHIIPKLRLDESNEKRTGDPSVEKETVRTSMGKIDLGGNETCVTVEPQKGAPETVTEKDPLKK